MSPPLAPCPDTDALAGFVDGHAAPPERDALERHIDGCAACRRALAELGRVLGAHHGGTASEHHAAAPRAPHQAPSLGRYAIRGVVGAGGMGVVYEGWDPALGRRVALKLVRPDRAGAADQLAVEARALAKVTHPNVLTVFDVGVEGGAVFLAAEYVEGTTLDEAWPRRGASAGERVEAYVQAGRGLAAIHAAGLTHRDIKPANLLLGDDGRVRVVDFGLAVGANEGASPAGTRAYMAPEQRAGEVTPAVDQFALGLCLVEALMGTRPPAGTAAAELARLGRERWGSAGPELALWDALARAIAIDPAARHRDVGALVAALEASRTARPEPAPRPARAVSLAFAGVALAALVAASLPRDGAVPTRAVVPMNGLEATPRSSAAALSAAPSEASAALTATPASSPPPSPFGLPANARPAASLAPAAGSAAPRAPGVDTGEATKLLQQVMRAHRERNGGKCLALIARAEKLGSASVGMLTSVHASCEMLAGQCEQGASRLRAAGLSAGVRSFQLLYCPADARRSSAEDRILAASVQAQQPPFTVARCEQLSAQVERAIGEPGPPAPGTVHEARKSLALCFAAVGDCARARVGARALFLGDDREQRAAMWLAGQRPECAAAR